MLYSLQPQGDYPAQAGLVVPAAMSLDIDVKRTASVNGIKQGCSLSA